MLRKPFILAFMLTNRLYCLLVWQMEKYNLDTYSLNKAQYPMVPCFVTIYYGSKFLLALFGLRILTTHLRTTSVYLERNAFSMSF